MCALAQRTCTSDIMEPELKGQTNNQVAGGVVEVKQKKKKRLVAAAGCCCLLLVGGVVVVVLLLAAAAAKEDCTDGGIKTVAQANIVVTPRSSDSDATALTEASLAEQLGLLITLQTTTTTVPGFSSVVNWNLVCDRGGGDAALVPGLYLDFPCNKMVAMDCFLEGGYDYPLPFAIVHAGDYDRRPSFVNKTDAQLKSHAMGLVR